MGKRSKSKACDSKAHLKKSIEGLESEIEHLKSENEELKASVEKLSYLDHLVEDGDVITDMRLYTGGRRYDEWMFVKLYGLTAMEVLTISRNHEIIDLINKWSTRVALANGEEALPTEFREAFHKYIEALREHLDAEVEHVPLVVHFPWTELGKAYKGFWEADKQLKELISRIEWDGI